MYNDYDKRRKPDRTEAEANDSNELGIAKKRNGFMSASSYGYMQNSLTLNDQLSIMGFQLTCFAVILISFSSSSALSIPY